MVFGIRQLRRASDLLQAATGPGDPAVPEAILSFLSACECQREWPTAFRERAVEIRRTMTAGGPPAATASALTTGGFAELRDAVGRFVADAEKHSGRPAAGSS
jgi:hypothetical protein